MFFVFRRITNLLRYFFGEFLVSNLSKVYLVLLQVKVGKGFISRSIPTVIIDVDSNITIGDNVIFKGNVELRALKGASLVIENNVKFDKGIRIVATNGSQVYFREGADVGCYSIFNCGSNLNLGKRCLVAGFCYFQTSTHLLDKKKFIQDQGYSHEPIHIGEDCWIGGGAFILKGVALGDGCVVAANTVVNKSFGENVILAGSPAVIINERS